MKKLDTNKIAQWSLIVLGFVQAIGFTIGVKEIRGIGLASVASPLPIVFTQFRGIETFALKFEVEVVSNSGEVVKKEITPEVYSKLHGPYNIRNVYGAVISYGAGFKSETELKILDSVLSYGVCDNGPLVEDFKLPRDIASGTVYITSKTKGHPGNWQLKVRCEDE